MLYSKIGSRNASDVVVEFALLLFVIGAIAANPSLLLVPTTIFLGCASVALPFVALAALTKLKKDAVTGAVVLASIALTEVWCYCLFKLAYHAQYGVDYVLFPK